MSPKLALTIGAVLAVLAGLGFTLAPAQLLLRFSVAPPAEAILVTRDFGVTLVGLGVLNWLAREVTGPAVRAILIGNLLIQVGELVADTWEVVAAIKPPQAAGGIVLHIVLGAVFLLALRRA